MPPRSRQQFGGGDGRRQSSRDAKREEERIQAQMAKQQASTDAPITAVSQVELKPAAPPKRRGTAAQMKSKQAAAQRARQTQKLAEAQQKQAAEIEENHGSQEECDIIDNEVQNEVENVQEENQGIKESLSGEVKPEEQKTNAQAENDEKSSSSTDSEQKQTVPAEVLEKPAEKPKNQQKQAPQEESSADSGSEPSWAKDISSDSEEIFDESGNQRLKERAQEKKKQQKEAEQAQKLKEQLEREAEERGTPLLKPGDLRAPIVVVLGHVDTGKTSLLDRVRRSSVQAGEAGGITQQIGASYLSKPFVERAIRNFPKQFTVEVPGLLLVDTPGHENFRNLRSRGQSLADVGVLVVDIMHGVEQQTVESLQLLKASGAPFVIALNKIDMLYGWVAGYGDDDGKAGNNVENGKNSGNAAGNPTKGKKSKKGSAVAATEEAPSKKVEPPAVLTAAEGRSSLVALAAQRGLTRTQFEERLGKVKEQLGEHGVYAELWTEVRDLKSTVPIIPTSAKTAEGLCDLLALLVRFCQQLQEVRRRLVYAEALKCTIMEVRRSGALGFTLDCILVNGVLKRGQRVAMAGPGAAIFSTVRQILTPAEAREIRDAALGTFRRHESIQGAAGFKIAGEGLEHAVAGSQLRLVCPGDDETVVADEVMRDLSASVVGVDGDVGVSIHGSSLGSLEALRELLAKGVYESEDQTEDRRRRRVPVPVSHVGLGPVTVKTVQLARTQAERGHREYAAVLAFGVRVEPAAATAAREAGVAVYEQEIVYRLLGDFGRHLAAWHARMRAELRPHIPCVLKLLHVFHNKSPVILGAEVLSGSLRKGEPLALPNGQLGGRQLGYVEEIQMERKTIPEGLPGQQVAVKLKEPHGKDANSFHVDPEIVKALEAHKNPIVCVQITRKCIDALKAHYKEEILTWVGCIKDSKAMLKID